MSGTISLKKFYVRRTLRIFPAFYAFLIAMVVCQSIHAIAVLPGDFLHAFTYTMNYHYDRSWWVGHIWSLSVEEQFYLLWPAVLLLFGLPRGMMSAAVMVFLAPVFRLVLFHFFGERASESFPAIADTIATGCLLAWYEDRLRDMRWFRAICSSGCFVLLPLGIIGLNLKAGGRLRMSFVDTLVNLGIAIIIARVVVKSDDRLGRVLNCTPALFVGTLSYSLYLWQQPFINRQSLSWISIFPMNLFLAFWCALVCHLVIEKPFLQLRQKAAPSVSNVNLPAKR